MTEDEPAVSRLCVATADCDGWPLHTVVAAGGFYRMHVARDAADGSEFAVAAPGIDEVSLISDLSRSTFRGNGINRVRALLRHPAIVECVSAGALPGRGPWLGMVITSGLFADLCAEGLPEDGWLHVAPADAWLRLFTVTDEMP
jgi:hypothetical protein